MANHLEIKMQEWMIDWLKLPEGSNDSKAEESVSTSVRLAPLSWLFTEKFSCQTTNGQRPTAAPENVGSV